MLNYEEGGEKCILHGDNESENLLSEIVGATAYGKLVTNGSCLTVVAPQTHTDLVCFLE